MQAKEMWDLFAKGKGLENEVYEAWAFGAEPDKLAELVVKGIKTGTASAYDLYEIEDEPLPQVGEYSVILDSHDEAVCIIKTTKVYVVPFCEVSEEHAYKEGEGDRSLDYWRNVHEAVFTEWLGEAGIAFSENMKVVCEEFEVVYKEN